MQELEGSIRQHHTSGDMRAAAVAALNGYGPEVMGYLVYSLEDREAAAEVFAEMTEDLWRGLEGFAWRCSFRTWIYTLARHALSRHLRAPHRRSERRTPLSEISEIAEQISSSTAAHLRTDVKSVLRDLRRELTADERTLLMLRIDRNMRWVDIARVFQGESDATDAELARESAKLRKRFETVKHRLRELMQREGLIDD